MSNSNSNSNSKVKRGEMTHISKLAATIENLKLFNKQNTEQYFSVIARFIIEGI